MAHVLGASRPHVEAGFGTPAKQNRWTVAFRVILAIPQFIVLWALGIGVFVVAILGWFAALFTGRMPPGFARFISQYIEYFTRVVAYTYLMRDEYPPFGFEQAYPVNLSIGTGPVRRLAVLFRLVLLVPAEIVGGVSMVGVAVASFVLWLIVLISGTMPHALFDALSAVLRFQARTLAYGYMLTGKYPGEIFGDAHTFVPAPAGFSAPAYGAAPPTAPPYGTLPPPAPPYGTLPAPAPPYGTLPQPAPPYGTPSAPTPSEYVPPAPAAAVPPPPSPHWPPAGAVTAPPPSGTAASFAPPSAPRVGPLVLAKPAKRLVALFIVLGVVGYCVYIPLEIGAASGINAVVVNSSLVDAHNRLANDLATVEQQQASCTKGDLACVQSGDMNLADAFQRFADTEQTLSFPSSEQATAQVLQTDTRTLIALLQKLSTDSPTAYTSDETQLENEASQFDSSYQAWADTT